MLSQRCEFSGPAFFNNTLYFMSGMDQIRSTPNSGGSAGTLTTLLGPRLNDTSTDDVNPANVRIESNVGQAASDGTYLYFFSGSLLRRTTLSTGSTTTLASGLGNPWGIALVETHLYFSDYAAQRIFRIETDGTGLIVIAGSGVTGTADASSGLSAEFYNPSGLATDGAYLYVADRREGLIRRVDLATTAVTTIAGIAGNHSRTDGPYGVSTVNNPIALATDGAKLYIAGDNADQTVTGLGNEAAIRVLDLSTNILSTLTGSVGVGYADGAAGVARFKGTTQIFLEGGFLYALDAVNGAVRSINVSTGAVTTVAGSAFFSEDQDGPLTAGANYNPASGYILGLSGMALNLNSGYNTGVIGMALDPAGTGIYLVSSRSGVRRIH